MAREGAASEGAAEHDGARDGRSHEATRDFGFLSDAADRDAGIVRVPELLDSLRPMVEAAVDRVARPYGRTSQDCPWIEHYFARHRGSSAAEFARLARRWVGPQTTVEGLRHAIVARVTSSASAWFESGRPPDLPGAASLLPRELGRYATRLLAARSPGAAADPSGARRAMSGLGDGHAVDGRIRTRAEHSYGVPLNHVRFHTGAAGHQVASAAGAHAVAFGDEVAFAQGRYRPGTPHGDVLIAHELAHVVQQGATGVTSTPEADANRGALAVLGGKAAPLSGVGGLQVQGCGPDVDIRTADHTAIQDWDPQQFIDNRTTGPELDEDGLAEDLLEMMEAGPDHYVIIGRVIGQLGYYDRDDVAAALIGSASDSLLGEVVRTEEGRALLEQLAPELTSGWDADSERYQADRLVRTLAAEDAARRQAIVEVERFQGLREDAPTASIAFPEEFTPQDLTQDLVHARERLTLIQEDFAHAPTVAAAAGAALGRIDGMAVRVADGDVEAPRHIQIARVVCDDALEVLPALQTRQMEQWDTIRARPSDRAVMRLYDAAREAWIEALTQLYTTGDLEAYSGAVAVMEALPRALVRLDIAVAAEREGAFASLSPHRTQMTAFAEWMLTSLEAWEADAAAQADAETSDPELLARLDHLTVCMDLLQHWDHAVSAATALESGYSFTRVFHADIGIDAVLALVEAMEAPARAGETTTLRESVAEFAANEDIKELYREIPDILRSSGIVVGIGITLVAALATMGTMSWLGAGAGAGVGAGAAAGTGSAGAASGLTAMGVAQGVGSLAVGAFVFTSTHRAGAMLLDQPVHGSFLGDFLWNFGLFGALKGVSTGIRAVMLARSGARTAITIGAAAPPPAYFAVQTGAALTSLQLYGMFRMRIEQGRWPTAREHGEMALQGVIVIALLGGLHLHLESRSAAGRLQAQFGPRFSEIETQMRALETEAGRAAAEGDGTVPPELQARAEALQTQMDGLLGEARTWVAAEGLADGLRSQLAGMDHLEVASQSLTRSLGMPARVALRPSGRPNQHSYRSGETDAVVDSLRDQGADVTVRAPSTVEHDGGSLVLPRTVVARFADGRGLMTLTERTAGTEQASVMDLPRLEAGTDVAHFDVREMQERLDAAGLGPDARAFVESIATEAGLPARSVSTSMAQAIVEADAAITRGDMTSARAAFESRGFTAEQGDALGDAIARARDRTPLSVYRVPYALLPDGRHVDPSSASHRGYCGSQIPPSVVFVEGFSARGANLDLRGHSEEAPGSAFRGTTGTIFTPDGEQGAGRWADAGGYVYLIDGVPGWDVNALLEGRVQRAGGFGGNLMSGEGETAILGHVPPARIQAAFEIVQGRGTRLQVGERIDNPNYVPLEGAP
ncbi:MAG: DUF4157 domain-containing protein [Alphaproteobacteria bacterium]|nr:DUF4157 domain-containing protein [Alphaproteobacteria bacterium]